MSQLIHMRNRMKAITTIKKVTQAIRLVSRSVHGVLNQKQSPLKVYQDELCQILLTLKKHAPNWHPAWAYPSSAAPKRVLYIIMGGQRGLCGNFNSGILCWMKENKETLTESYTEIIALGNKTIDLAKKINCNVVATYNDVKLADITNVTDDFTQKIITAHPRYSSVIYVSNHPKSFLTPQTKATPIIPIAGCSHTAVKIEGSADDFVWLNSEETVLDKLLIMHMKTLLHTICVNSLLAEQATRFVAMDQAMRNADKFLDALKLQYNKLRQAKITKELMELTGGFESHS